MPAGNGGSNWSPKQGLNKTASTGEEKDDKTLLYEAALKVVEQQAESCGPCMGGDDFEVVEEVGGLSDIVEDGVIDVVEDVSDEVEIDVVDGDESSVEEVVENAEQALEQALDAVHEVKDSLSGEEVSDDVDGDLDGVDDEVEIEVEIDDAGEEEVLEDDGMLIESEEEGCPSCGHKDDAVEVESNVDCYASDDADDDDDKECDDCGCKDCECETVTASGNDWVKLSAVSPTNRKKLYDYWSNKLGYPKDFVKLMVKDYEK